MNREIFSQLGKLFIKAYNLKAGDIVLVTSLPDSTTKKYFEFTWMNSMNGVVGRSCKIERVDGTYGDITLKYASPGQPNNVGLFPFTCLKVIKS